MASFLLFTTEAEAIAAEARATSNVREYVRQVQPDRVAEDGTLIGINANTWQPQPAAARTVRWAVPEEGDAGWLMPLPTIEQIYPVPIYIFMDGLAGRQVEIPPQPEEPTP